LEGSEIRYKAKMGKYPELGDLNHWWWRYRRLHRYSFDYLKLLAEHISTGRTDKSSKLALNGLITSTSFCLQRNQGIMPYDVPRVDLS
jgi:hypothetical protein